MLTHHFKTPTCPERVVILGASGFVAGELAKELNLEKIPVVRWGRKEVDLTLPDAQQLLTKLVLPTDSLVMAAALTPDKGKDVKTLMKNIRMAETLCAFLENGACAHVVYISSDAVYDGKGNPLTEESSCEPPDLYSLMHLSREKMLGWSAAQKKIPMAILRPCAIYGVTDTHNSYGPNRFMRTALEGTTIKLFGQGEEKRDHVYIRDVVRLIMRALQHRSSGILNLASGQAVSFHDLVRMIGKSLGRPLGTEFTPRSSAVVHRHFDPGAIYQAFPDFKPTPPDRGLVESLQGLRNQPGLS